MPMHHNNQKPDYHYKNYSDALPNSSFREFMNRPEDSAAREQALREKEAVHEAAQKYAMIDREETRRVNEQRRRQKEIDRAETSMKSLEQSLKKLTKILQKQFGYTEEQVQDMAIGIATIPLLQRMSDGLKSLFRGKKAHVKQEESTFQELLETWRGVNDRLLDVRIELKRLVEKSTKEKLEVMGDTPTEFRIARKAVIRAAERRIQKKQKLVAKERLIGSLPSMEGLGDLSGLTQDLMEGLRGYRHERDQASEQEVQRYLRELLEHEIEEVLTKKPELDRRDAEVLALEHLYEKDLTWEDVKDASGKIHVRGIKEAQVERRRFTEEYDLEYREKQKKKPEPIPFVEYRAEKQKEANLLKQLENTQKHLDKALKDEVTPISLNEATGTASRVEYVLENALNKKQTSSEFQTSYQLALEKLKKLKECIGCFQKFPPKLLRVLAESDLNRFEYGKAVSYALKIRQNMKKMPDKETEKTYHKNIASKAGVNPVQVILIAHAVNDFLEDEKYTYYDEREHWEDKEGPDKISITEEQEVSTERDVERAYEQISSVFLDAFDKLPEEKQRDVALALKALRVNPRAAFQPTPVANHDSDWDLDTEPDAAPDSKQKKYIDHKWLVANYSSLFAQLRDTSGKRNVGKALKLHRELSDLNAIIFPSSDKKSMSRRIVLADALEHFHETRRNFEENKDVRDAAVV